MTTAKRGAGSRNKGYRAEAALVKWLHQYGYTTAHRRMIGERGYDIWGVDRGAGEVALEVKSADTWTMKPWLEQAEQQAKLGQEWVLIIRIEGLTDPGQWLAIHPWEFDAVPRGLKVKSLTALQHVWPHLAPLNYGLIAYSTEHPALMATTVMGYLS